MKRSTLSWKELLAVAIAIVAFAGVVIMWRSEGHVFLTDATGAPNVITRDFYNSILPAIKNYSMAIGGLLLAISISYILLGSEEDISTSLDEQELKK